MPTPEKEVKTATLTALPTNFAEAHALGEKAQILRGQVHRSEDKGKPFLILETFPGHFEVKELENFGAVPDLLDANVTLSDADSFIRYVNDFKDGGSRIFALFGDKGGKFRAVLDYHEDPKDPRWCQHVAEYTCPTTPEWDDWMNNNAKLLTQDQFSEFVEKQRLVFRTPDAATMLEIARTLEATKTGTFRSEINPANGNRTLHWKDETEVRAGGGKMEIPTEITVALQPFRRGSQYTLAARLLHRIRDGKAHFAYELVRAHETVETALKEISAQIVEKCGIVPYNGVLA